MPQQHIWINTAIYKTHIHMQIYTEPCTASHDVRRHQRSLTSPDSVVSQNTAFHWTGKRQGLLNLSCNVLSCFLCLKVQGESVDASSLQPGSSQALLLRDVTSLHSDQVLPEVSRPTLTTPPALNSIFSLHIILTPSCPSPSPQQLL